MATLNIPNLKPDIKIDYTEALKLALVSLALSEISLAEVLSAEAKKIECFIEKNPSSHEILKVNQVLSEILTSASTMEKSMNDKFDSIKHLIFEYTYEQQRIRQEEIEKKKLQYSKKKERAIKQDRKVVRW